MSTRKDNIYAALASIERCVRDLRTAESLNEEADIAATLRECADTTEAYRSSVERRLLYLLSEERYPESHWDKLVEAGRVK